MMRINKYIAKSGIASRRNADKLIEEGKIKINGEVISQPGVQVKEGDVVEYNNEIITPIEQKYYYLLNKPVDYACTNSKEFDDKIIFDLIDNKTKLFSIGRLDKDSRGLIIITNDGDIYNSLIHPKSEVFKTYVVRINKKFLPRHKNILETGIDIGGYVTSPSKINIIDDRLIEISISEGKNRQIRRMFKALNYEVLDLNRVAIGEITSRNLKIGAYRNLSENEVNYLKNL